jgi:hypothetical protein
MKNYEIFRVFSLNLFWLTALRLHIWGFDNSTGNGSNMCPTGNSSTRFTLPTGNSSTTPLEMVRHLFLPTGNGSTLFSAHWKWFDTRSVATLHYAPLLWQHVHALHGIALHISAMKAQNATELGNLGVATLRTLLYAQTFTYVSLEERVPERAHALHCTKLIW